MAARKTYDCEACDKSHPLGLTCQTVVDKLKDEVESWKRQFAFAVKPDAPSAFPNQHLIKDEGMPADFFFARNSLNRMTMEGEMVLEVNDSTSGTRVFEMVIDPLAFIRGFIGCESNVGVKIRWYSLDRIGTKHENRTVVVPMTGTPKKPHGLSDAPAVRAWEDQIMEAAGYLKDGWFSRHGDMDNFHKRTQTADGGHAQSIVQFRYVDPGTGEPIS